MCKLCQVNTTIMLNNLQLIFYQVFRFLNYIKKNIFQSKDKNHFSIKIKTVKAKERKQALLQNEITIDFVKTQINDRNVKNYFKLQFLKVSVY